jgi:hypothetical protein
MKLKKILAGHLLVLGLIFPHAVFADDFTFNIEVEILSLHPDVNQMRVACEIEGITQANPFKTINVPANGGAINTTIQVIHNEPNGMPALNPEVMPMERAFACFLEVSKAGGSFVKFLPSNGSQCSGANKWRCARTGTPSTTRLEGRFDVYTE